jgi:dihydrodipicolinate synthase/N-acetylneuraminate lyase
MFAGRWAIFRHSPDCSMNDYAAAPEWVRQALRSGLVIPAHPLALDRSRSFDERRQRALTRYYHASGAGGLAVGVHTTQFEIRQSEHGLYEPVLRAAADVVRACDERSGTRTVLVAGVAGRSDQAVGEARRARELGYDAGLLSLGAMHDASLDAMIAHADRVAREIPLFGFYLQPAVGGVSLPYEFWRRFAEIPNLVAIKIAPFDRYRTLDVVRAVVDAGRVADVALYTGNDDAIVTDLLTEYDVGSERASARIVGGLLGQWACWTSRAVELLAAIQEAVARQTIAPSLLRRGAQLTLANAAIFDVAHGFRGSIAGVNEVLRRQGLLETSLCLDPHADLSPGQALAIDAIARRFPDLTDDEFVRENVDRWMAD